MSHAFLSLPNCSNTTQLEKTDTYILLTCANQLHWLDKQTLKIAKSVSLGPVEPIFGCKPGSSITEFCPKIQQYLQDFENVQVCDQYVNYETYLLKYYKNTVILCSKSQTLIYDEDKKSKSGSCHQRDFNTGNKLSYPCAEHSFQTTLFYDDSQLIDYKTYSTSLVTSIKSHNFDEDALLVLSNYGDGDAPNAIAFHQLCDTRTGCVGTMVNNKKLVFSSLFSNSGQITDMKLDYERNTKSDWPLFKFALQVQNSDGTNGILIIQTQKDSTKSVIGHMCTDISNWIANMSSNPYNIFRTYREVQIDVDGSNEVTAATVISQPDDKQQLILGMKDGSIYAVYTQTIEDVIREAIRHGPCRSSPHVYNYVPWGKHRGKPRCAGNTEKDRVGNDICSDGGDRYAEYLSIGEDLRSNESIQLLQIIKPVDINRKLFQLYSEPQQITVLTLYESHMYAVFIVDVNNKLHTLLWDGENEAKRYHRSSQTRSEDSSIVQIVAEDGNKLYSAEKRGDGISLERAIIPDCSKYTTCESCLTTPFGSLCSWCLSSTSCAYKCLQDHPKHVLNNSERCPRFVHRKMQKYVYHRTLVRKDLVIKLPVQNLDENDNYNCVWKFGGNHETPICENPNSMMHSDVYSDESDFSYKNFICEPLINNDECGENNHCNIHCNKPVTNETEIIIGIVLAGGTKPLVTASMIYLDCSKQTTCESCLQYSESHCRWCYFENNCQVACEDLTAFNVDQCPKFKTEESQIVYDESSKINLVVDNLSKFVQNIKSSLKFEFLCDVQVGGNNTLVNAKIMGEKIQCEVDHSVLRNPISNKRTSHNGMHIEVHYFIKINLFANFRDLGKRTEIPRILENNRIMIYDCPSHFLCDDCLSLYGKYGCGYSSADNKCTYRNQGRESRVCKDMKIYGIDPENIVLVGNEELDVAVHVKGRNFNQGTDFVTQIGGHYCKYEGLEDNYRKEFTCRIKGKVKFKKMSVIDETVKIIQDDIETSWNGKFHFTKVSINEEVDNEVLMFPNTTLTIIGENLNFTSLDKIQVNIANKYPCLVFFYSATSITCRIEEISKDFEGNQNATVQFTGHKSSLNQTVEFIPVSVTSEKYDTIDVGGTHINITGKNVGRLHNNLRLSFKDPKSDFQEDFACDSLPEKNQNNNLITCIAPARPGMATTYVIGVSYGENKLDLEDGNTPSTITYRTLPKISNETLKTIYEISYQVSVEESGIVIIGENFCLGSSTGFAQCDQFIHDWIDSNQYRIYLMPKSDKSNGCSSKCVQCEIQINNNRIICSPMMDKLRGHFTVFLAIGNWTVKAIETVSIKNYNYIYWVIGVAFALVVIFGIFVLIIIWFPFKSRQSKSTRNDQEVIQLHSMPHPPSLSSTHPGNSDEGSLLMLQ